ncbi:hypothetical protein RND71_021948 [Anisodus tanguticus]|uniref:ARGOS-like protein n=1 Tax=Anisodus tanguticus TaxID=243964 RepID=A0AAE1RYS6_9SOLA|nr:hypothetical protein RND71_021948 [Anisodus tanguticus]
MDMSERSEAKLRSSSKGFINLEQHHQYMKNSAFPRKNIGVEGTTQEYRRSQSGKKVFSISYFSLESFLLLLCLSASLLLLPLILPPLPPPPFMLLLLPILILLLLMFLAFMPSNVKSVSNYTHVS